MRYSFVLFGAVLSVAGCGGAPSPVSQLAQGMMVTESIPFHRGIIVPLPPGAWRVIADDQGPWGRDASGSDRWIVLVQERDGRADRIIMIAGTTNCGRVELEWNVDFPCRRGPAYLAQDIRSATPQGQDCRGVVATNLEGRVHGTGRGWGKLFDEAARRPGWLPEVALANLVRLSSPTDILTIRVFVDPRSGGVDASRTFAPGLGPTADWEGSRISVDRRAFAAPLIAWSEAAQPAFRSGWPGQAEPLPPLP